MSYTTPRRSAVATGCRGPRGRGNRHVERTYAESVAPVTSRTQRIQSSQRTGQACAVVLNSDVGKSRLRVVPGAVLVLRAVIWPGQLRSRRPPPSRQSDLTGG